MVQAHASLRTCAVLLAAAALTAGCSLFRPTVPSPPPAATQPSLPSQPPMLPPAPAPLTPRPPAPPAHENTLSPATRALVTQANAQAAHGDLPAASSTLERALRIEPSNPLLWVELGRLRLSENDPHQAEVCGRKALALASADRGAQGQAGRLLADALRAQRRNQEAREVESQPFMN
ncbi:MAG: tetratricopeptide repeat protein [Steroidobacteraceae bacterium]|jgi:tetratricopeptide (TPR) repeat protein